MAVHDLADAPYPRESIAPDDEDSLARVAAMIRDGARVLDLGTARGALGRALSTRGCVVDGVEQDPASADIARPSYRRLHTADLEQVALASLFPGERYDVVVCADVLEHLREPERVLASIPGVLREGGELLVSVPNIGYTGVVLDLLLGHFEYRPRGLLDRTHVRFFTRESIIDLLERAGFGVRLVEPLPVALERSEFSRISAERLDPALLAALCRRPDGRAYQFLVRAVPGATTAPEVRVPLEEAAIGFQTQLYWRGPGQHFQELQSRSFARSYAETRHRVTFTVPPGSSGLRWDAIDRPGLVSVHRLELLDGSGTSLWSSDGTELVESPASAAVRWTGPSVPISFLSLGADPWIELPVPAVVLGRESAELLVDFSVFPSHEALRTAETMRAAEERAALALARSTELLGRFDQRLSALEATSRSAEQERSEARTALDALQARFDEASTRLARVSSGIESLRTLQITELRRLRQLQEEDARGLEARLRQLFERTLRTAGWLGLPVGERTHEVVLHPLADVEVEAGEWRATGPDPQIEIWPVRGTYPQGQVALRYRIEADVEEASVYVDHGNGYSEGGRVGLRSGQGEVLLTLPPSTRGVRIDPRQSPGRFVLTDVELVELPSSESWSRRLRRGLGLR